MEQDDLEGRLLAHRRMLQLIVGALAETTSGERLHALFRDRSTMQDGQEDPGAVETAGMGVELALAEEFRRTVEGIPENAPPATGAVRLAGPELDAGSAPGLGQGGQGRGQVVPGERPASA